VAWLCFPSRFGYVRGDGCRYLAGRDAGTSSVLLAST
jgi:hypothetical protein